MRLLGWVVASALVAGGEPVFGAEASEEAAKPAADVVAVVNGEPLYSEDLERVLEQLHEGASSQRRGTPDLERMMFRLVNDTLLAQEARALGMDRDDPIPGRLAARRESLAVERLEREEIWSKAEPSAEEITAAFEESYQTITFRIITVHEIEKAQTLRRELEEGADFARLAREQSVDPYGPREGLVKDLARIDMPLEVADSAFSSPKGEVQGPIATRIGWALVRTESVKPADPARLEALRPSVRALVRLRKAEVLRAELGEKLRAAHPVSVDEEVLRSVSVDHLPDLRLVPRVPDPDAVVARVGERTVSAAVLGAALRARWQGVRNEEAARAAVPIVLDRLIRTELMAAEALARGYGDTKEARRTLHAMETQLLVSRYLREVVASDVEVTPEEMKAYYEEHKDSFHRPPRLLLRQVTVATMEEAERVAALLEGGADIAWIARRQSIDGLRDSGGDLGWLVAGRVGVPFADALFEAQPGDVLGPEEGGDGFVVGQVGAREEQGIYTFEEISGNVRRAVASLEMQQAIHRYIETLRSRSRIEIHEDVVAALQFTVAPAPEASHPGGMPSQHPR